MHIVTSPAEAEKLTLKFINDQVDLHDKRLAQAATTAQDPQTQPATVPQSEANQRSLPTPLPAKRPSPTHVPAPSTDELTRIDPNFKLDPVNANRIRSEILGRNGDIPPLLVLNNAAYQVVARLYGHPVDGVNLSLATAKRIITKIRQQAAASSSTLIRAKLNNLAAQLERNATKEDGLSVVHEAGRTKAEFRAIQEELFHSVGQRNPGKGSIAAGTPHEAFISDSDLQKMEPRLTAEGVRDHVRRVAEAIQDIWSGEAVELSSEEQIRFAEKYWEQAATKNGDAVLQRVFKLWQHLQQMARQRYNFDNAAINEVMNEKTFEALQRVIARRTRTQDQSVQGTNQPINQRVLPQHRGREETGRGSGESEEPGTESGGVDRPPSTGQTVFLPNGRPATIQFISPAMNVAVIRMSDGGVRTIKLSEIRGIQPRGAALPVMGRNMTADAPAVHRVRDHAKPISGQVPEVKVKQEPLQVQAALTRPPAPVRAEEARRIGQIDVQSGRQVLQPSNSLLQNERLAADAAPYLTTKLSEAAASVPGARFDRLRPQKGLQRLEEKVADGKPPSTIGDNLAAQIVADTVAAKDQLIGRLRQQFPVISVDDKFLEPREKAGYPSTNLQLQMPNGGTAEVQIVTPEIQAITDRTHRLYTEGRNFPEGSADRNWYWNQAAATHRAALEKFLARNAQPSATTFAPGEKVLLRNGQTGKVVGPSRDLRRIVVRTPRGMRTVKPQQIHAREKASVGTSKQNQIQQLSTNAPKLFSPSVSQKVQDLLAAFVPLKPEKLVEVAASVESSIEPGADKLPDVVWVNQPAMHLVWSWAGEHHQPFAGIYLDGASAEDLAQFLEGIAIKQEPHLPAASQMLLHLRQVKEKNGAVAVVLRTGEKAYDQATAREERGHVIQDRIGIGDIYKHANLSKLWMEPEFQKATQALAKRGYQNNPPDITMEAATKLLLGEGKSLGLSRAERTSAVRKYLRSIIEEHGTDAAEDLKLISNRAYHRIFNEAKNEARSRKTQIGE